MGSKILSINWLFGGLALIKNVRETYSTIGAVLIFIPNLPLATKLRDWKNTRYLRFHFLDRICFPWLRRKNYVQKFGQLVLFSKYNLRGGQFQFHKITILINFVKMDQSFLRIKILGFWNTAIFRTFYSNEHNFYIFIPLFYFDPWNRI